MSPVRLTGVVFLPACAGWSAQFVPTNPYPHASTPHPPSNLEVFSSGPPTREHIDVGVIDVIHVWGMGWDDYLHQLRDEASRRGGDAVVIGHGFSTCVVYTGGPLPASDYKKDAHAKPSADTNVGWDRPGPPEAFPAER